MEGILVLGLLVAIPAVPRVFDIRIMYTNCWLIFTAFAMLSKSNIALGLATSMGFTTMIGWYTLRLLDRNAWPALLNGWLGIWSRSTAITLICHIADSAIHFFLPLGLFVYFSVHVKIWMSLILVCYARFWCYVVVGGTELFPVADHVYHFDPPRSKHFWVAAYKLQLLLDTVIPILCEITRTEWTFFYNLTLVICCSIVAIYILRQALLPVLRDNAKAIMSWLLLQGDIVVGVDLIVHDESVWLDWMTCGMLAIGESYMAKQWDTSSTKSLDEIVAGLLSLPAAARRQMFHSWHARVVSLLARILNYPPSCQGLVVGSIHDQFDLTPEFFAKFRGPFLHDGFSLWSDIPAATNSLSEQIELAEQAKLRQIVDKLGLKSSANEPVRVLDLSRGSAGSMACYMAKLLGVEVLCVVNNFREQLYAEQKAREFRVVSLVKFLSVSELDLETLPTQYPEAFTAIVSIGWLDRIEYEEEVSGFMNSLRRMLSPCGRLLIEFVGSTRSSIVSSQVWTNSYIFNSAGPKQLRSVQQTREVANANNFTVREVSSYSDDAFQTFIAWDRRFQETIHNTSGELIIPESFKRTWEFYVLHTAACYRVRTIEPYQMLLEPK